MSVAVFKMQFKKEEFPLLKTPVPLGDMKVISNSHSMDNLRFTFQNNKGYFIEFDFEIATKGSYFFVVVKVVGTSDQIIIPYLSHYVEMQNRFPIDPNMFIHVEKRISSRKEFKEYVPEIADFFKPKEKGFYRKGQYAGVFVKPPANK